MSRVQVPPAAAAELTVRYRAREAAEQRLVDLLTGITLAMDLPLELVTGFDDETGELLLSEAEPTGAADQPATGDGLDPVAG